MQVKGEATQWSPRAPAQQGDPGGARKVRGLHTKKTTQPSQQWGGVVGFFMFFDLLQIGLKLHLVLGDTGLDQTDGYITKYL